MLTEAYNQNVSVREGGGNSPISGKIFYTKNYNYSNARITGIYTRVEEWGKWLHVAINTLLHKV